MKNLAKPAARGGRSGSRRAFFVALFGLLVPCAGAQKAPEATVRAEGSVQAAGAKLEAAKFTDETSALGINFEYVASHTSKKYLIETMGSGVALFDYDNDGRLDIFVANGTPHEAKIEELRARGREHDVAGLEIAVDDSAAMRLVQGERDLRTVFQDLVKWEWPFLQPLGKRFPFNALHNEVVDSVLMADIV